MLKHYFREVERLRGLGKDWNLTDEEIDRIIDESFRFLEQTDIGSTTVDEDRPRKQKCRSNIFNLSIAICLVAVLFCLLFTYRRSAHNYLERNIQELIYPGMKLLRKIMLPVVRTFPSLTEWYDEACLVSNPYFQVSDIDCWPCESVRSVLNLTISNLNSEEFHSGIPFVYRDINIKRVSFKGLRKMYKKKKEMFDRDAPRIESLVENWKNSEDLFDKRPLFWNPTLHKDAHIVWKLNRLEPTREVRAIFGFPKQVPSYVSGVTPEKFVIIDEPASSSYEMPSTEGTTVFLIQGSGSRLVILDPSSECRSSCHRVSVLLMPHHILWYNWWYWRATSVPVDKLGRTSITYLGSYY